MAQPRNVDEETAHNGVRRILSLLPEDAANGITNGAVRLRNRMAITGEGFGSLDVVEIGEDALNDMDDDTVQRLMHVLLHAPAVQALVARSIAERADSA